MHYEELKHRARKLRKNQTPSEQILWRRIRKRRIDGFRFLRQYPLVYDRKGNSLNAFIPDFYCAEARLVIEVDGGIHLRRQSYDRWRDAIINSMGIEVLRIRNEELAEMDLVLNQIRMVLTRRCGKNKIQ